MLLFDSFSHTQLGVFQGLAGPASCLRWGVDDAFLSAGDPSGVCCTWDCRSLRQAHEHRGKTSITSLAVLADPTSFKLGGGGAASDQGGFRGSDGTPAEIDAVPTPLVLASGGDGSLRQVGRGDDVEQASGPEHVGCVAALPKLRMVACGTSVGSIACIEVPLHDLASQQLSAGINLHCGAMTAVLATQRVEGKSHFQGHRARPGQPLWPLQPSGHTRRGHAIHCRR